MGGSDLMRPDSRGAHGCGEKALRRSAPFSRRRVCGTPFSPPAPPYAKTTPSLQHSSSTPSLTLTEQRTHVPLHITPEAQRPKQCRGATHCGAAGTCPQPSSPPAGRKRAPPQTRAPHPSTRQRARAPRRRPPAAPPRRPHPPPGGHGAHWRGRRCRRHSERRATPCAPAPRRGSRGTAPQPARCPPCEGSTRPRHRR
eukprot:3080255-Prymnesium_polylepis.1